MPATATPAPEISLHREEWGELLLLPAAARLVVRWHGFANSRQLRQLLNRGLELYRQHAVRFPGLGWLADTRRFGAMLPADQQWVAADWNARAWAAGIRHLVYVQPETIFGQIALQQYARTTAATSALRISCAGSVAEACRLQ
ncbi:hypothetical protein KLP40_08790 [Hymenobacter sp. NST-14]|uniref:hypothetical protein n=1 Tax=Hymenobacter piscis TaxID=2839984 RepID=UPI001C020EB9|nr:hypothetical protein [Hymenobacter piscis]MBT9393258.1 hypothetical protein [Hymenobacter piscis]